MQLGMIGLGRMGANMAQRLMQSGHEVVGLDAQPTVREVFAQQGGRSVDSAAKLVQQLPTPRVVWLMLPAGVITQTMIDELLPLLEPGDTLVDGGNSFYQDSMRRSREYAQHQLNYLDCGTSGGIWGLTEGYCLMIGGEQAPVERLTPIFQALAPSPDRGWAHVGPAGAGHFSKMVHNGIEYGMMQALAEGFSILSKKTELDLDVHQIADLWRNGSVVRSWLLDLTASALKDNPGLKGIAPYVRDSGEGRWAVAEAIALDVSAPVITLALLERLRSREPDSYGDKLLAAMRNSFGGHAFIPDTSQPFKPLD
ncbi:6-phosphogluconate dehydrogenase (decarboxylating) [Halopseudomonas xinjiangensis]|uniref:6-phosphogluconate dehydrogenase (Decarboxylating) n=1 Tax=Halopseudomonas xinjiangensis TaxID=487184 RepID=A0A1H1P825_9GAMM|nr:decarboxylating 6-phosphogluconate dehydrogenase [Halopseudomonas xinjiangensis]SDS07347.1 6-phosphogluconate dehydrogenase (decarboxylating) [Halopseudomonas xinjiangensis]